jgi:hypothetical protein
MTTKIFKAKHRFILTVFLTTVALVSNAELPDGEFACQVLTESGQSGLVMVQADAETDAVRAARTATAWELGGGKGKAISVVECITLPDEKFKDSWFNSFYESFPM